MLRHIAIALPLLAVAAPAFGGSTNCNVYAITLTGTSGVYGLNSKAFAGLQEALVYCSPGINGNKYDFAILGTSSDLDNIHANPVVGAVQLMSNSLFSLNLGTSAMKSNVGIEQPAVNEGSFVAVELIVEPTTNLLGLPVNVFETPGVGAQGGILTSLLCLPQTQALCPIAGQAAQILPVQYFHPSTGMVIIDLYANGTITGSLKNLMGSGYGTDPSSQGLYNASFTGKLLNVVKLSY